MYIKDFNSDGIATIKISESEILALCNALHEYFDIYKPEKPDKRQEKCCMNFDGFADVIGTENMVKAVEKQIPRKIDFQLGMYVCPRCGCGQDEHKKFSYCHFCGQHIDWSE